jgi:hypothetical protein
LFLLWRSHLGHKITDNQFILNAIKTAKGTNYWKRQCEDAPTTCYGYSYNLNYGTNFETYTLNELFQMFISACTEALRTFIAQLLLWKFLTFPYPRKQWYQNDREQLEQYFSNKCFQSFCAWAYRHFKEFIR